MFTLWQLDNLYTYGLNAGPQTCLERASGFRSRKLSWRDDNTLLHLRAQIAAYYDSSSISELDHSNSKTSHMEIHRHGFRRSVLWWHMLPKLRFVQ